MKIEKIKRNNEFFIMEAIQLMADIFAYADKHLHIDIKKFFNLFNKTKYSERIYLLDLSYVCGKSAIEIAKEVLDDSGIIYKEYDANRIFLPDESDWTGLIIASYCYAKKISFISLEKNIDINEIKKMFYPLHEAPHIKTIELIDKLFAKKKSRLHIARERALLSQSELSAISGVSLRSIQMYEQRNKNINRASFETIRNLAYALRVHEDELYEVSDERYDNLINMY